jgi:SAM-dependent methyltransferase
MQRGSKWFLTAYWSRELRKRIAAHARVLEVGCGVGFFVSRVAKNFSCVGLDIAFPALSVARRQRGLRSVVCADAEALPCRHGSFDAVVAFDVIEHLHCPENFLAEASRVLRDGGLLILTTPNPESFGCRSKRDETDARRIWFGYKDETHISIRSIKEWRHTFRAQQLAIVRDGTDFLWDPPYFAKIPRAAQRLFFIGTQWLMTFLVGFLPWRSGENYVAILRKGAEASPVSAHVVPAGTVNR